VRSAIQQPYKDHIGYTPWDAIDTCGGFQSERYFLNEEVRETIRRTVLPPEKILGPLAEFQEAVAAGNIVALHLRRHNGGGDAYDADLSKYYSRAIDMAVERFGPAVAFCIISKDPVEQAYPPILEIIERTAPMAGVWILQDTPYGDAFHLFAMTLCNGVICSNSAFAWWGAWLNARPAKFITLPSVWRADTDRIPEMAEAVVVNVS
jgi:hypothetical protein